MGHKRLFVSKRVVVYISKHKTLFKLDAWYEAVYIIQQLDRVRYDKTAAYPRRFDIKSNLSRLDKGIGSRTEAFLYIIYSSKEREGDPEIES